MSDLVERLRSWHTPNETITGDVQLYLDAADRIEALEAALREKDLLKRLCENPIERMALDRIEALEAALRLLASDYLNFSLGSPSWTGPDPYPIIKAALDQSSPPSATE